MAISLKHDAFGVVPPSNAATRKYGQSLVLQQQQQKYAGQQAGYDRLFRAGSQLQQQNWQGTRDKQINDFQAARDKQQFDWKQQEAETARQAGFLDDARKMSTGIIMDDIKNGAYDTATASQLRQNLIDEAEALGNPNLDATQRAEILAKIRAKRATLTANRIEAPPKPTPDDELRGSIRTLNGVDFKKDKDGIWQPVDYGKGQQGQQQPPQRPTSVDDAIRADSKRYDAILDYEITALTGEDKPLTPELLDQARERARKQYEKELGLGTPTLAPELPGAAPATPGIEQSILETGIPIAPPDSGQPPSPSPQGPTVQPPDPGRPPSPVQQRESIPLVANDGSQNPWAELSGVEQQLHGQPSGTQAPPASSAEYDAQMKSKGYRLVTPSDGGRPYYLGDWGGGQKPQTETRAVADVLREDGRTTFLNPDGTTTLGPAPDGTAETRPSADVLRADGRTTYLNPDGTTALGPAPDGTKPSGMLLESQGGTSHDGITMQAASEAAKQYEGAAQQLQSLQSEAEAVEQKLRLASRGGESSDTLKSLKAERERLKGLLKTTQESMDKADKTAKGYYDQEIAKQPAVKGLAKAGKRPQDFAEAEFQLKSLRKKYPDISSMPAEAKKQLKEAMAVIQAGR